MKSHRIIRRSRRAWPPTARIAAAIILTAALALLAAACNGSPSSAGLGRSSKAGGSQISQLLAFARCMRSHGVPDFPDPSSASKFPGAQQLGVGSARYRSAVNACQHLLPNAGNGPNQAELEQERTALLPFARCMRSDGVSDWPDPSVFTNSDGETAVVFNFIGTGLDGNGFNSPQVQAEVNACQHLLPPSHGGPPFQIVRSHG
jgi:hypothetical protein